MKKQLLLPSIQTKTKALSKDEYDLYLKYEEYAFNHYESLKANLILDELLNKPLSKDIKASIQKQVKAMNLKQIIKTFEKDTKEKVTASLLITIMTSYLVCLFVKEVLANHYLIHLYVDSLVAVVAFYTAIHQIITQYKYYRLLSYPRRSFYLLLLSIIVSLILSIITYNARYDFTFVIIVIGGLASKRIFDNLTYKK